MFVVVSIRENDVLSGNAHWRMSDDVLRLNLQQLFAQLFRWKAGGVPADDRGTEIPAVEHSHSGVSLARSFVVAMASLVQRRGQQRQGYYEGKEI